jgi:hypothetical protein
LNYYSVLYGPKKFAEKVFAPCTYTDPPQPLAVFMDHSSAQTYCEEIRKGAKEPALLSVHDLLFTEAVNSQLWAVVIRYGPAMRLKPYPARYRDRKKVVPFCVFASEEDARTVLSKVECIVEGAKVEVIPVTVREQ